MHNFRGKEREYITSEGEREYCTVKEYKMPPPKVSLKHIIQNNWVNNSVSVCGVCACMCNCV